MDDEFLNDLCRNEEAAAFYNQFCKEFYNADYKDAVFVKDDELKKQLNREHYARNVCVYNIKKATGSLRAYKPGEIIDPRTPKD